MAFRRTSEPGKLPAGLLAILVHLAFFVLLVFGVTWRIQSPAPVTVDLWDTLPSPPKARPAEPPPQPRQELPPPEPKPEPRPEPKPEPKAEPEPTPKPDIALKEKEEKKKLEEERRRLEEERKELEKKKAEERKSEEERKKQEKLKEEQAKRLAAQKEAQAKAAAEKAANEASNAVVASYIDRIKAKIERSTQVPENVVGHPHAEFRIVLLPTGELLSVTLVKSSGNPAYDDAVARGIKRAEPLPLPPDPTLLPRFRELNLPFTHEK